MDYQDPPYAWPNDHDYEQLDTIYGHLDSYNSYDDSTGDGGGDDGGGGGNGCNAPPGKGCNKADYGNSPGDWGDSLGRRGQVEVVARPNPDGSIEITRVVWARGH